MQQVLSSRAWQAAAVGGGIALLAMISVSRAAGATATAVLWRGLGTGFGFAAAILAGAALVRLLGEPAGADRGGAERAEKHTGPDAAAEATVNSAAINAAVAEPAAVDAGALAMAAAAAATATAAEPEPFAPLVVPRVTGESDD